MIFKSENNIIDPTSVTYRSLGFGEPLSNNAKKYTLSIKIHELPEQFYELTNALIAECIQDDNKQGYADIPELRDCNYPPLSTLIKNRPDVAATLIKDYLFFELFYLLFPSKGELELLINSISGVYYLDDTFHLCGETYPYRNL
ncbi:UNVERIFIED_ORG: hypothetical protein J2X80_004475 [Pseudomonas fluorescens]|uniref:hypothetical protein n=1 Tax=Pseudomonas TaxID=286 RepID=UPI000A1F3637|nr:MULTISPECIES: hypothetical protein [unclassified Pseudomonas]MDP9712374.1 hypothetical protein [Pseudomonas fluorescens]